MCYSSQIRAEYKKYVRIFGADISIKEYFDIYWRHLGEPESKIKIPKAIDFDFADPQSDEEREIEGFIDEFNRRQTIEAEQELFKQRKPLADAERTLLGKPTKAAAEQAHRDQQNRGAS